MKIIGQVLSFVNKKFKEGVSLMKKWTKLLGVTLVFGMAAFALTGCGEKKPVDPQEPEKTAAFVVLEEDFGAENYAIGFRNGDIALGLEVQKQLDAMMGDGTAAEISNKWFGEDKMLKDVEYYEETEAAEDDNSLQNVLDKKTFVLGLDDSFPPMGFRDEENNIVGFDIDLATEVAKRMGVELVVQPIDWDAKEMELNSGKIDCIWNGMSVNDDRLAAMFIAKPYIGNRQIIIVPGDSDIKTIADLKDKVIGLQKGSSALDALNANEIAKDVKVVVEYPENVSAFMDLKAGRVDAFVVDEVVGKYIITNDAQTAEDGSAAK